MRLLVDKKSSTGPVLCALVVASVEIVRTLLLFRLPDSRLVQNIPDDAFYYLQSARNFILFKQWTFDGVEPSSGFHILWGYLLALCYWIAPHASLHAIFIVGSLIQCACLSWAAFLVAVVAGRFAGSTAWGGVLLVMLSAASLRQGTWLMESSLVIAVAASILHVLTNIDAPIQRGRLPFALFLGFVATLCRSDAGLFVFWLLLARFYLYLRNRQRAELLMVSTAAAVFAGAACGVLFVAIHTHWISGQWTQASAAQKLFWSRLAGWSISPGLHIAYSFFNPLTNAYALFTHSHSLWESGFPRLIGPFVRILLIFGMLFGIGMVVRFRPHRAALAIALAALLTIVSYSCFYGYDSAAVQEWYVGNYEVPAALLAGIGFSWFLERYRTASLTILLAMNVAGIVCSMRASFPWQEAMWRAGVYLHDHPERRPVGSWNAGIIGYFANNGVVNMDGLMNDAILPYAKNGTIGDYMVKRHLAYIFESPQIWKPMMAARGGYANGAIQRCIEKTEDPFPSDPDNFYNGDHIRIYTFDKSCLAAGKPQF